MKMYNKLRFFKDLISCRITNRNIPLYVYWFITDNCNLKCQFCYGVNPGNSAEDLSTEDILKIADELIKIGTRRITLLGGEPLLREDINLLLDKLYDNNVSVLLLTNGTLLPQKQSVLDKIEEIGFSIEGRKETHEKLCGKNSFSGLVEAIRIAKQNKTPVVLTYTMVKQNIDDLEYVLDFAKSNKVLLTINVAHRRIDDKKAGNDFKADNDKYRRALEIIMKHRRKGAAVLRAVNTLKQMYSWEDYQTDTADTAPGKGFPECSFGKLAACVSAQGNIYPCFVGSSPSEGINILDHGIHKAWDHCMRMEHCKFCHIPCFLEYNALFALKPYVVVNIIKKIILKI